MEVKVITVEGIEAAITATLEHVADMPILDRGFGLKRKRSLGSKSIWKTYRLK